MICDYCKANAELWGDPDATNGVCEECVKHNKFLGDFMTEPKWHPYPEEKPGERGRYLVTRKMSGSNATFVAEQYWESLDECWGDKVIAWMEEPSPCIPPAKKKMVYLNRSAARKIAHDWIVSEFNGDFKESFEIEDGES